MADEPKGPTTSDWHERNYDLVAWLIGVIILASVLTSVYAAVQGYFERLRLGSAEWGPLTAETPLGTRVKTTGETEVWSEAGGGELLGIQPEGALGVTVGGPEFVDGEMWWDVDFDDGVDGWVRSDDLLALLSEGAGFSIGSIIETIKDTNVWEEAGGGVFLGIQKLGAIGKIIDGFVDIDGERWWKIDFKEGVDGWISESSMKLRDSFLERLGHALTTTGVQVSIIISLLLLTGIVYSIIRLNQIRKKEIVEMAIPEESAFSGKPIVNERWINVLDLVDSDNPNDWRAAIIEADIMLNELMTSMSYSGENLGEKLKGVEKSDFTTIDLAWEAHKVRNKIAHQGGDFILTQREAQRVIGLFKQVFNEFKFI